ncbi:YozE family protein [Sorangium sp. So ce1128]
MSEASDRQPVWVDQKAGQDPDTFRNGKGAYALTESEQETLLSWIRDNFVPAKSVLRQSSYTLKHSFESASGPQVGFYITNGHFKGAMLAAGFESIDPKARDWYFRVRRVFNKPKDGSFLAWLVGKQKVDGPVRDLAQDAARDRKFPNGETTIEALHTHPRQRNACGEAHEALDEAWKAYQRYLARRQKYTSRGSQHHASQPRTSPSTQ